jgi:hypothetical protein
MRGGCVPPFQGCRTSESSRSGCGYPHVSANRWLFNTAGQHAGIDPPLGGQN